MALGLSHHPCYTHDHDYERYFQIQADHVTMDLRDYQDQDLDRQNMQGRKDRVTLLEVEASDLEADCAADTSSYSWVVVPSSVH